MKIFTGDLSVIKEELQKQRELYIRTKNVAEASYCAAGMYALEIIYESYGRESYYNTDKIYNYNKEKWQCLNNYHLKKTRTFQKFLEINQEDIKEFLKVTYDSYQETLSGLNLSCSITDIFAEEELYQIMKLFFKEKTPRRFFAFSTVN